MIRRPTACSCSLLSALTGASHPAPILGARLQIQKHDPTENGGGEHNSRDGYEVHLFYSPLGVGDTRLLMTSICDLSTHHAGEAPRPETPRGRHAPYPSTACRRQLGRTGSERKLSTACQFSRASCHPAVSRPQWSHCNQRRPADRAMRSS